MTKVNLKPTTDPIADMLSRLRNAAAVHKISARMPHSNVKEQVAQVLYQNGYLAKVSTSEGSPKYLELQFGEKAAKPIVHIERVSKPGRRCYVSTGKIPTIKNGRGICIVSTPAGMLSGHKAKQRGLGGELICKVW